ncbi:helix-turn-helix transcriptional regulator [Candidatus Poriferisodalis sp.]|uniref:helix-turn-helix transcriptional regulator n=1 Tax=Candidatus Poriferisodalis sp. TaxID=3101277 RepID=UPI003B515E59
MKQTAHDPPALLLSRTQIERLTGLSCSSLYRAMRRGEFPEPLRIGHRSVRWRADEIQAWIDGRPRASGIGRGAA